MTFAMHPPALWRWALVALTVVASIGCETKPVDEVHHGRLANGDWQHPRDNSWYDEYSFEAKQGWEIDIQMSSEEFDPFLELRRDGADEATWLQQNDDVSRSDRSSRITVTAPADDTYRVWANSFEFGEQGAYTLTIKAHPPSPGEARTNAAAPANAREQNVRGSNGPNRNAPAPNAPAANAPRSGSGAQAP